MTCIDVHAHYLPPSLIRDAQEDFPGVSVVEEDGKVRLGKAGQERAFPPALASLDDISAWMDQTRIDGAVLSGWGEIFLHDPVRADAGAWHQRMNERLLEDLDGHDRFVGAPSLPLEDPAASTRLIEQFGSHVRSFTSGAAGIDFSTPALVDVWQAMADAGTTLILHPEFTCQPVSPRLPMMANLWARTSTTTRAMIEMTLSKAFVAVPDFRVIAVHGGGGLAMVWGRLRRTIQLGDLGDEVLEAARRAIYVDAVVYEPELLHTLLTIHGADRILLGSDAPMPIMDPDPIATLQRAQLPAEVYDKITYDNAAQLGLVPAALQR